MEHSAFSVYISTVLKGPFRLVSFSHQFLAVSFAILGAGMIIIGTWIGHQIEHNTVNRAAAIATVYVESILATRLHAFLRSGAIDRETRAALNRIFVEGPLKRKIVRFKLWGPGGTILYSSDDAQSGRRFPVEGLLAAAFAGEIQSRISNLDSADNTPERVHWSELLEVYVPLRSGASAKVSAVAEFYHSTKNLGRDIRAAKRRSWALVAVATSAMYVMLLAMVRRANNTITHQQRDLNRQLRQLQATLGENDRMRQQLRDAAARATAFNEQFLHRVAADLHDGPAQEIALALMRLESLEEERSAGGQSEGNAFGTFETIYRALRTSLADLRNTASGLGIPKIADLSFADTVRRAVTDFEEKFGTKVKTEIDDALSDAPLAVRITVYRLVQESLNNGWIHARGATQQVLARRVGPHALVEVADQGPGFVRESALDSGRLGLAFMRERVRLVGGVFDIETDPGRGTRILARLPLSLEETAHA